MRSVRCENCGARALIAASTCPKCQHEFDVRDASGEMLPLAYCSSCDSYYPERLGSCRWCGTVPERTPVAPYVWKGVGVAAFVALAVVGWRSRDAGDVGANSARSRLAATGDTAQVSRDSLPVLDDTTATSTTVASAGSIDTAPAGDSLPAASMDTVSAPTPAPTSAPTSGSTDAKPPAKRPSVAPSLRTSRQWVSFVSRTWVTVRARPHAEARIVASVGPNARVQLGETRGGWRRIRARGLSGWVEHDASFREVRSTRRSRGVAAR